ncbi:MAG TPA: family 20 glycosylhydrolase, partial [Arachidicoccus sp.]|nr:family 20 glycosylhydrolase [Arachidicoccus sp.]
SQTSHSGDAGRRWQPSSIHTIGFSRDKDQSLRPVIPAPASMRQMPGFFTIGNKKISQLVIVNENQENKKLATLLQSYLNVHFGLDVPIASSGGSGAAFSAGVKQIVLTRVMPRSTDLKAINKEAYHLKISPEKITISAEDSGPGLFYGLQSLFQLMNTTEGNLEIPCTEIEDVPRYPIRSLMLGVSYHLFPVSYIKELIDLMATYKLNTLHWHLTDDTGWRIEIKKYPLLTRVGAWRSATQIGKDAQALDDQPYGGYYSQEEIKDIVSYARERYITIIPEIEMPGHSMAALAAYPWLGFNQKYKVATTWGIYNEIYAPKDSTFAFLEDVLTEVMALFPGPYIHIGGDEVPKNTWATSPFCQQLIKTEGLKDEAGLQSYFIRRIEKFINANGRKMIGWDEILEGGLAPNATVESWRGTSGGIEAAKQGHDVVMAPTDYVYFDYLQGKEEEEPLGIGGFTPLSKVYGYDPTPKELSAAQQRHILGVEACVWTEFIATPAKFSYMIFPRMMALAEIGWSPLKSKDYTDFLRRRLPVHLERLDRAGMVYRVPEVIGITDTTLTGSQFEFTLHSAVAGAGTHIYYTLDGFDPDLTCSIYEQPLKIRLSKGQERVLKARVITASGKKSVVTTTVLHGK